MLADVDLSGRLDVVAPASVYPFVAEPIHMVHVLLDDGAGGFLSSSWSLESRQLFREALADFNRDGAMDLVYATEPLAFRIALGGGDGTFLDAGAVGQPGTPGEVVTTDFNQDGRSDFAAQRGADILGYFGNGTGSIPPLAFTITANRLYRRSAVDMNRDGRPDLVTRGSGTRILNVVAQLPDGTFQTSTVVSSGGIQSLATGDWNRDGKPDVAVAMSSGVSYSREPGQERSIPKSPWRPGSRTRISVPATSIVTAGWMSRRSIPGRDQPAGNRRVPGQWPRRVRACRGHTHPGANGCTNRHLGRQRRRKTGPHQLRHDQLPLGRRPPTGVCRVNLGDGQGRFRSARHTRWVARPARP